MDEANQKWEVRKVISKEYVEGVLHNLAEWCPTLEPQHSLGHAKELVDEFEAQLRAHRGAKAPTIEALSNGRLDIQDQTACFVNYCGVVVKRV
jgi:hypothetical protein